MPDPYSALWVSHTSLSSFLKCPRAYFLQSVYKDPKTRHKIQLMAPPLALGQVVHEVLESLSVLAVDQRFSRSLIDRFDQSWKKVAGKKGGFLTQEQEAGYKARGEAMLRRAVEHPGPLKQKAVKIKADLPQYWFSESDEIILCGKIDWLEYLEAENAVHIIDFKTSTKEEDAKSLQLPIYHLLVHNIQHRRVARASYWYLEKNDGLTEKELPDLLQAHDQVMEVAKKMKVQRKLGIFKCPHGESGCFYCKPLEKIIKGEAEFVGYNGRQDSYILNTNETKEGFESEIL